jgi:hypothetical protein
MTVQVAPVAMNEVAAGILSQLKQPDRREISEWAVGNVIMPDSKRSREWREDTAYWLIEPLNAIPFNEAVSVCKPTQSGGTVIYIVFLLWLVANSPVDCALMGQTDPDAEYLLKAKILPALRSSPATAALMAALGRNDVTKSYVDLGTMTFRIHGPGKNSTQSASLEVLMLDECWLFPLGTILEILERTSTREATRKIVAVSQAGEEMRDRKGDPCWDEWGNWWHRGTQEIFHVRCPSCSSYFEPLTSHFTAAPEARHEETHEWNWNLVRKTVRLTTPCCNHVIRNTPGNRRDLSASGKYIATNPNPAPRHRSFRYSAWVVYWQDWGGLLEMFLRAQVALLQGNVEPLKIWTQKKESRWWLLKDQQVPILNTRPEFGYALATYEPHPDGTVPRWEHEKHRVGHADVQANCFKVVFRAFAVDGSSRQLWSGTLPSYEAVEAKRKDYRIPKALLGIDANEWTQSVYARARKYGWTVLHGLHVKGFTRVHNGKKMNLPWEAMEGRLAFRRRGDAGARGFNFSNRRYKDQLSQLIGGRGVLWAHPDDVSEEYLRSLESEVKNEKGDWVEAHPDNHHWDNEVGCLVMASLPGVDILVYDEPDEQEGQQ